MPDARLGKRLGSRRTAVGRGSTCPSWTARGAPAGTKRRGGRGVRRNSEGGDHLERGSDLHADERGLIAGIGEVVGHARRDDDGVAPARRGRARVFPEAHQAFDDLQALLLERVEVRTARDAAAGWELDSIAMNSPLVSAVAKCSPRPSRRPLCEGGGRLIRVSTQRCGFVRVGSSRRLSRFIRVRPRCDLAASSRGRRSRRSRLLATRSTRGPRSEISLSRESPRRRIPLALCVRECGQAAVDELHRHRSFADCCGASLRGS